MSLQNQQVKKSISPGKPRQRGTLGLSLQGVASFLCVFSLLFLFTGCGGGPDVSQKTGHGLLLATSQGIFNVAFSSNGSSALTSSTPVVQGSVTAMVTVPNASYPVNGNMLVTTNGTALTAYLLSGGVPSGSGTAIKPSCTSSITYTSLAVTLDGQYLLATGSATATLDVIALSPGYSCTQNTYSGDYPQSVSVECLQINQPCQIFLTLSTTAPPTTLTVPGVISWQEGSSPGSLTSLTGLTPPASSAIFDTNTSYFYALATSSNNSTINNVSGVSTLTGTSKYNTSVSLGNIPFSAPCLDPLGQNLYTPTSNGSVFISAVSSSGSIGTPNQIWSLASDPSGVTISPITSCAAY